MKCNNRKQDFNNLSQNFVPEVFQQDTKFKGQIEKVFRAFYRQPKTMLMVSIETGILRANICRYIALMERESRIKVIRKGICPISKHYAGYYTTNPDYFKEPTNKK